MTRLGAVLCAVVSTGALAQDFELANRQLAERSNSRACDSFTAFLKAAPTSPLAREATAKRAFACQAAGKRTTDDLRTIADSGEKDFARAWANAALFERGERAFDPAIPLLKQAAAGDDRPAAEARALLVANSLLELDRNQWNTARVDQMATLALTYARTEGDKARARFGRGRSRLNTGTQVAEAERELLEVGSGSTDLADDALFVLAQRRESDHTYLAALEFYDSIVKRFSPTTSNVHSSAQSRAADIRRPWVSISAQSIELPGGTPSVSLSWRNVKNASWALTRFDPLAIPAGVYPDSPNDFSKAAVERVSTWSSSLDVATPHEQGAKSVDVDVKRPGAYVLQVTADGQTSSTWLLVTQTAIATRTDSKKLLVFVSDVETGAKKSDSEVAVFIYRSGSMHEKLSGRTNADGVASFPLERADGSMKVWAKSGTSWAFSNAGNAASASWYRENLAYAMTDRPLYKPGETVGLKLFVRSREGGPSAPLTGKTLRVVISDPQGKRALDENVTTSQFGTATLSLPLPQNAPLGAWSISMTASDLSYRAQNNVFRVEAYKPPEYTVSVEPLSAAKPGEAVRAKVKAAYYSGGPVANASGRALVTVRPWQHVFAPWPSTALAEEGEVRRRWYGGYGSIAQHTIMFKTGADGTAELSLPAIDATLGYQDVEYALSVLVTDASRREIQGSGSVKVSSQPWFTDVRTGHDIYRPGERVAVELRAEDPNGKPVSPDVVVRLQRLNDDGSTGKIAEVRTRIVNGRGAVVLDADAVGRARVEVVEVTGATERVSSQSELWLTSDTKPLAPPARGFRVYVDRTPLKAGETVRALVATNRVGGHVLVTIESDLLHAWKVVELKGRAAFVEFPLTAVMAPNAWLSATRFEDTMGLVQHQAIKVAGSEVEFPVTVSFDRRTAEPGSKVSAQVATTNPPTGPLELSLTVVDEALFAIEPEKKDFLSFFARTPRQLAVRSAISQNERSYRRPAPVVTATASPQKKASASEFSDKALREEAPASRGAPAPGAPAMERAKSAEAPVEARAELDDAAGAQRPDSAAPIAMRTNFGSSAGWFPQLTLTGGALTQPVALTDSLTSWKAIATVVSTGPNLGQGAGSLRTAKSLMVRLQAPRFFVEGDEVVLSAVIESHLPKASDLEVVIGAPGFKALTPASKTLRVEADQTVRFDAKFKVVELGQRTIRATVRGGGASDGMEWTLPAFVHGSAQRQFFTGRLGDTQTFEFDLPEKRKPALTTLELSLSPSLLAVMFDGLPYLAQYPYGCVEQTLSRFVPATIARRAVRDLKLPADRVPANLDDMTQQGLDRLASFQHADGGWGWWQSDTTNDWMTAYVIYALALARDAGLQVSPQLLSRGRAFAVGHLGRTLDQPETHAFVVYALAASGGAPKAALDTLYARRTTLSARGRALTALALLASRDPRARVAVENLDDVVKAAKQRADASVGEANDAWSTSAAIEATALTLMAYAQYDLKSPLIAPLTDFLVLRRNGGRWRTTRDTAFAIYALSELARREKASAASASFVVAINGKPIKRVQVTKGGLDLKEPFVFADDAFRPGRNVVAITRDGAGTGYWAATFDVFNMNDFIKGVGGDVKVKRTYTLLGKPSTNTSSLPSEYGMPVESGVRVRVDLEVTANKAVEFVMLEDLKPAGFEAVELRSGPQVCNYACSHAELRTDRVAMFLSALPVGTTKLSYELRAEVPGRFAALPARFEAMYAPELQATADEMRFEVRDEPAGVASH